MLTDRFKYDPTVIVGATLVFGLPLTLLFPSFSVWDVVPKVRVERLHFIEQELTWSQSNTTLVTILALFFCLFLEMRKRKYVPSCFYFFYIGDIRVATEKVVQELQVTAPRNVQCFFWKIIYFLKMPFIVIMLKKLGVFYRYHHQPHI